MKLYIWIGVFAVAALIGGCGGKQEDTIAARARDEFMTAHEGVRMELSDVNGNPVPVHLFLPPKPTGPVPVVIAVHGMTGSKNEWMDKSGYTKGGDLSELMLKAGMAIVAFDMGYHGEHYLHTKKVNYQKVVGKNRSDFIAKSEVAFDAVLAYVKSAKELDENRLGMMSYSLGGGLTFYVANQHPEVRAMACMVPPNSRDQHDAYAPLRHQERLQDTSVLVVFARDDEYIPYDNSMWMYEQLTMPDKKMLSFQSGHSLPAEYVNPVFSWLHDRLLSARDDGEENSDG